MKKFFSLMLVALVMLGVTACEQNVTIDTPKSEGLSFYAEIAMTRASINDDDGDKIWNTTWEGNETLTVYNEEYTELYKFTNSIEEPNKFSCTEKGVEKIVGKNIIIELTHGEDCYISEMGKKGLLISEFITEFNPTETISLHARNSFLRYTYEGEGAVTLSLEYEGMPFITNDIPSGASTYTSSNTGEQWVSFDAPNVEDGSVVSAVLSYSINDIKVKETTINLAQGKVYNLGTLTDPVTEPVKSDIGVVGSFQGWDVANPMAMYESNDGWIVATDIELYKTDEFKFVKGNSWDVSYGGNGAVLVAEDSKEYTLTSENGQNIKVTKNGKFDIYFNPVTLAFKYECVKEYTDLTVDITIDNKANWNPLYITLKSGDIVIVDGAEVTDNKYAVSGDYIGESLSYTLSNGSKTVEGNVSITKDGATINLEETVIKLKVTLDTDNSKQWWGNTMKIHVWGTGTSFDTSWPGNVMTSEGNYTWSIVVPSELVGKTINYLVHNGNGWQSSDATVTIAAEGNTVTGSSIGIN